MSVLRYNMRGPEVTDLQNRLNCRNPTRLPRLRADSHFGVFTMARVMEFQSLNPRLRVDGVAGDATRGALSTGPATCPRPTDPTGRCILVDLINRRLFAYRDGRAEVTVAPIIGGRAAHPSTRGVFTMDRATAGRLAPEERPRGAGGRLRHHTSSLYPEHPDNMQFSLFYNGSEAIHLGDPNHASHGCIHCGRTGAEQLFNWAGTHHPITVIVVTPER